MSIKLADPKDELEHVYGDIEHVQYDMVALISYMKNLDEHQYHQMGETEMFDLNPIPF